MIRRPPRSTLFPTRRSSDLLPGGLFSTNGLMSCAPAAASISAAAMDASVRIARSFSPKRQLILRSEEHTSELQSPCNLVCRLLLEKKKKPRAQQVTRVLLLY